jgi:hypothetical protein
VQPHDGPYRVMYVATHRSYLGTETD